MARMVRESSRQLNRPRFGLASQATFEVQTQESASRSPLQLGAPSVASTIVRATLRLCERNWAAIRTASDVGVPPRGSDSSNTEIILPELPRTGPMATPVSVRHDDAE